MTTTTTTKKQPTTEAQLNIAAGLLLDKLPDHLIELFDTLCKDYLLERWKLVCGLLLEAYMNGRLTVFTIDPDWADVTSGKEPVCGQCKKVFRPERLGQKYCSNDCGTQAEIARKTLVPGIQTRIVEVPDAERDIDLASVDTLAELRSTGDASSAGTGWGA